MDILKDFTFYSTSSLKNTKWNINHITHTENLPFFPYLEIYQKDNTEREFKKQNKTKTAFSLFFFPEISLFSFLLFIFQLYPVNLLKKSFYFSLLL